MEIWNSVWPNGSLMGTDRTRSSPSATCAMEPAATTPFRRDNLFSESQGRDSRWLGPPKPPSVVSTTEVADNSSKVATIWLPAVSATPKVATRAAIPSTAPSAVRSDRPGRVNNPARASEKRSRGRNRERGIPLTPPPSPPPARRAC